MNSVKNFIYTSVRKGPWENRASMTHRCLARFTTLVPYLPPSPTTLGACVRLVSVDHRKASPVDSPQNLRRFVVGADTWPRRRSVLEDTRPTVERGLLLDSKRFWGSRGPRFESRKFSNPDCHRSPTGP